MADEAEFECPGDNCGHPIKESDLKGIKAFSCPNCELGFSKCFGCGTFNTYDEDDEDDSCVQCHLSFMECPTDDCDHEIETSIVEKEESFDCPDCGEGYNITADEEEEPDEPDPEPEEEPELEPEPEPEPEPEEEPEFEEPEPIVETVPTPAKKKQRVNKKPKKTDNALPSKPGMRDMTGTIRHSLRSQEYLDFFIDRPDGVDMKLFQEAFTIDLQAAHYARRKTFAEAESLGMETEVRRKDGTNGKLFFIREI